MSGFVVVKFNRNYTAPRGPGIAGAKGEEKTLRMTDALKECIDKEICEVVRKVPAEKRKKAATKSK